MRPQPVAVLLAGKSWNDVKGTDRHVADALSERLDVLWVDPALSLTSVVRRGLLSQEGVTGRVIRQSPRLRRLSVVGPPGITRPIVRSIGNWMLRRAVRRELRASGSVAKIIINMNLLDCSDWAPGARSVVYLTDDLPAGSDYLGISRRYLVAAERRAVLTSDIVVCVSDVIADRVSAMGRKVHVIPNGCDVDIFERAPTESVDLALPPGGVVGLAGNLNQRIDWDIVEAIAAADINVLLVGPVRDGVDRSRFHDLCSRRNVRWTGQVEHEDLPAYLAAVDVGITPYVDNDFNRASFPLKTLEYLAAGLGVVSSDLPAVRWLGTDLIRVASSPQEFVDAVRAAFDEVATPDVVARRRSFARSHSWRRRADDLLVASSVTGASARRST